MKSKIYFIRVSIIILLAFTITCIDSNAKCDHKQFTNSCTFIDNDLYKRYPIQFAYFQNFINSDIEFTEIQFRYYMNICPGHHDVRKQYLRIHSDFKIIDNEYVDVILDSIQDYDSFYNDWNTKERYSVRLSRDLIIPMFELILDNADYLFNAEEYHGEEYLEYLSERELGFVNHLALEIFPDDRTIFEPTTSYSFIKGWNPGDDPPEGLMPLINYLENVIIPELRQHPVP
jgi:hypothetical protein